MRLIDWAPHLGAGMFLCLYWLIYGIGFVDQSFVDAKSYWLAAKITWTDGASPYEPGFAEAAVARGLDHAHPFVYPPPSLLMFIPMAWVEYRAASIALLAVNHIALLVLAVGAIRWLAPLGWARRAGLAAAIYGALALILAAQATRVTLGHGQVNLIVLAGLVWLMAALAGRAPAWSGAAGLIAAALLKPYMAVFALLLLRPGGTRILAPAVAGAVGLLALTAIFAPVEIWGEWLSRFALSPVRDGRYFGVFDLMGPENMSLSRVLAGVSPFAQILAFASLIAMAALLFRGAPGALAAEGAALLAMIFLFAPLSWTHYAIYPMAGGVLAGLAAWLAGRPIIALGYGVLCLSLVQTPPWLPDWLSFAGLCLLLWAFVDGFKAPRAPLSPHPTSGLAAPPPS